MKQVSASIKENNIENSENKLNTAGRKAAAYKKIIAKYSVPDRRKSIIQMINSIGPYLILWVVMYLSLEISYWLTLALAVPTAGFLVRIFIIFHDCGHGSFFKSHKANLIVGFLCGLPVFAPYHTWRYNHAVHHATSSDLARRGTGDVWTATVREYLNMPRSERIYYRFYRNPFIMFTIGPLYSFLFVQRFVPAGAKKRERNSVYWTNLAIVLMVVLLSLLMGIKAYLLIQFPVFLIATIAGVWLFYVQHQFEGTYWEEHENWNYEKAALEGSSFYKLPVILQWFSGNIGFHHIHHLNSRIPNYNLPACHEAIDKFKQVKPVTFAGSLKSLKLRLWDEDNSRLVGFGYLKSLPGSIYSEENKQASLELTSDRGV